MYNFKGKKVKEKKTLTAEEEILKDEISERKCVEGPGKANEYKKEVASTSKLVFWFFFFFYPSDTVS